MRLIRFIHEQMTKPNAGIESNNEQAALESRAEQECAEENDCANAPAGSAAPAI